MKKKKPQKQKEEQKVEENQGDSMPSLQNLETFLTILRLFLFPWTSFILLFFSYSLRIVSPCYGMSIGQPVAYSFTMSMNKQTGRKTEDIRGIQTGPKNITKLPYCKRMDCIKSKKASRQETREISGERG